MEKISNQNETQSDPNDLDLVNYYQERAVNASNISNSNNSNLEQPFRDSDQNQIENQSNQNQHHHSSNQASSPNQQSISNQNFQKPSDSIIFQTNMNENENNSNSNPYLQPNNQPNREERNSNIANPYLQPNPQEGNNNAGITNPYIRANIQPNPQEGNNNRGNPYLQPIPQELMNHNHVQNNATAGNYNTNPYLQPNNQPSPQEGSNTTNQNSTNLFQVENLPPVQQIFSEDRMVEINLSINQHSQRDQLEGLNVEDSNAIRNPDHYQSTPAHITRTLDDTIAQNSTQNAYNSIRSQSQDENSRPLPPYVSATPKLLADIDSYEVEYVVNGCGENVPWTDFFFHLIGKGETSIFEPNEPHKLEKVDELIDLFTKKAKEVGEELIDAYIDGNFDYLEKFRVDVGGIAGGRKYLKSNILFKFSIDAHRIYKDNRNSMKVASQELRVINHLVNEKSLNRLFVLPCLALITKCGLRMYASSLLPLDPKESLKYGCQNLKQSNRIIKKDDCHNATMNNIFNLIGQTLNLKSHSIAGDKNNTEIICADIEGHLGTDRNHYLVDTTRLFPPEAPFNNNNSNSNNESNEHLFTFLRPELVKRSPVPLNNDCFSVFWNGSENQRKEEEGNIRKLSDSIYSTLIPELSHSIQQETIQIKDCDDVKYTLHSNVLCLRHLPYLIENILVHFSKLSNEAMKSLNFLLIEMFSRILKWKWYSLRGNEKQKQSETTEMMNQYFSESNKERISNWIQLLNEFFSIRALGLKNSNQFSQQCSQFLEDLFDKIFFQFSELCGIEFVSNLSTRNLKCTFQSIVKSIDLPKPKSLKELIELKNEQESKFGKDSLILASTLFEIAHFHFISKQPNLAESTRWYEECLRIYELHGKQFDWQVLSIQLELIQIKDWTDQNVLLCQNIKSTFENKIGKQHPRYAAVLRTVGNVLMSKGKFEEALKYYEKSLKIEEQTSGTQHLSSVILNKIGSTLIKLGRYEEALRTLEKALKLEETIGQQHFAYGVILNSLALVFELMGNFEQALKYYKASLNIQAQTIGEKNPNYAATLTNIGSMLSKQGKFDEALNYLKEALRIQKQTFGNQHPRCANTSGALGSLFLQKGEYKEALKYYEESLKIEEQTIGKQHSEYAGTLVNIGGVFARQGRFKEALNHFQKALEIQEQTIGNQHPNYASTLHNIGDAILNQGKLEESLKYFEKCLKIQEQTIGKQHPEYASALNSIGAVFYKQGKLEKAFKCVEESLKIQEKTIGNQSLEFAELLANKGSILNEQGKLEESLKCLKRCLQIEEQTVGKQNHRYAQTLATMGEVLHKQSKLDEAIKHLQESMKILEQTIGKQHVEYQKVFNFLQLILVTNFFKRP